MTTTARPARSTSPPRRPPRCATSTSATSTCWSATQGLDRALERLPTGDELRDRAATGGGLTMPEFADRPRLQQDRAVRRAARLRRAGGPVPRPGARAVLPRGAAQPLRGPDPRAPAAARDHRDARHEQRRRPGGHHLHLPPDRGDGNGGARRRAGAHGGSGDLRAARRCGRRSRSSTTSSAPTSRSASSSKCGGWPSGRPDGCCATAPNRWTSPRPPSSSSPACRSSQLLIPTLVTEDRRRTLERTVDGHVGDGVPEDLAWSVGNVARPHLGPGHRHGRPLHRAPGRGGGRGLLRARRVPEARLAAGSDPRPAA